MPVRLIVERSRRDQLAHGRGQGRSLRGPGWQPSHHAPGCVTVDPGETRVGAGFTPTSTRHPYLPLSDRIGRGCPLAKVTFLSFLPSCLPSLRAFSTPTSG